jgi:K+-transporting ATPase ATPase C chain
MTHQFRPAIALLLLFTVLLGLIYPLALTGVAQVAMPGQANGSLITQNGTVIGSTLIGQQFSEAGYFHGRPSAAGNGYDASASSGSNLGPTSQALIDRTRESIAAARSDGGSGPLPGDLVTASASGLDPDLSPSAALIQAQRIAAARGMTIEQVRSIVARSTRTPLLGFIGEPRVNVLALNRQLDRIAPQSKGEPDRSRL